MKKNKILLLVVAIIFVIFVFVRCSKKETGEVVVFADKQFEAMVQKELDKDIIYTTDLSDISGILIASDRLISFSGGGHTEKSVILFGYDSFEYDSVRYTEFGSIKSLKDLKYFPKLTSLRIYLQPSIDFNTIPNRENITNLGLSQNQLTSLEFLEEFDKLLYLTLSSNDIVSLDGLENVKTIKRLGLNSNKVNDISILEGFNDLEYLDLTFNKVKDVSSIADLPKLNYLSLYENGISDISPLKSIKSLTDLYLNNNEITDISPLNGFKSFENLNITNNPITNYDEISHIKNVVK